MGSEPWRLTAPGGVRLAVRSPNAAKIARRIADHFYDQGASTTLFVSSNSNAKVELSRTEAGLRVQLPPGWEGPQGWAALLVEQLRILNIDVEVARSERPNPNG